VFAGVQGSADSNYSQHSSDLSLEEDIESRHRENERHALTMLEKARVCDHHHHHRRHRRRRRNRHAQWLTWAERAGTEFPSSHGLHKIATLRS